LEERLRQEGIDIAQKDVFHKNKYRQIPVSAKKDYYPLSSAQKRMYILNQMEGFNTVYNTPEATLIEGDLDKERLENVFKQLVRRHEALRTSFAMIKNEPMQQIHEHVDFEITHFRADEHKAPEIIKKFIRPFDLTRAPLFRVGLIELSGGKHILIRDLHHIISDGSSRSILIDEMMQLYHGQELPELRIQYKDYSEWQNAVLDSDEMRQQEEYWLQQFQGELPVLDLPTDYPRPALQSFEGDNVRVEIRPELTRDINKLLSDQGVTLYMILLAAYNVLLSKYSGKEDIIVGSPIAGRHHADLQNIVGMFVNTLAMRNKPFGEKTFTRFLGEVKENSLKAYANQSYQFETLIDKLNIERDSTRNPLFDTMFVLQNMNAPSVDSSLCFRAFPFVSEICKFDITLEAIEAETGIKLNFEFCTKLFDKTTIQQLAGHFINILKEVCQNPGVKLAEIDFLSESEKNKILCDFNRTTVDYLRNKTIVDLFEEQVANTPDQICIQFGQEQLALSLSS
jgi:hypothetical protein